MGQGNVSVGAARLCGAAVDQLAEARAQLLAAGDVEWTGEAAAAYGAVLADALDAIVTLRDAAERTWRAAARHEAVVRAAAGPPM